MGKQGQRLDCWMGRNGREGSKRMCCRMSWGLKAGAGAGPEAVALLIEFAGAPNERENRHRESQTQGIIGLEKALQDH